MKLNNTVITLALVGVLALAALAGGLLPVGSPVYAVDPVFADSAGRSVDENTPPGVNIGDPVSATDADEDAIEYGNTLTYSLGGTDAASFDIDPSTGQLITKAPLDAEATRGPTYSVTVTVDDGETRDTECTACTRPVTITVEDVEEPPAAPAAPTVVSGAADASTTSLKVVWHEPDNTGEAFTGYAVTYKKTTDLVFLDATTSGTDTTTTITGLDANTSYHVRVRATSGEGDSPWSLVGTGSTNKTGNSPPSFGDGTTTPTRSVFENTPAGEDVGSPVTANDTDAASLTYRLEGPHASMFAFVTSSGQILTKSPLNHESAGCGYVAPTTPGGTTTCTHRVTVAVSDGAGGSDATAVNIMVSDRHEPVLAPARPTVRATEDWSTRLDVSWSAPENTGAPITGYEVRYREGSSGEFLNDHCGTVTEDNCVNITDTKTTIVGPAASDPNPAGLSPGASYQVQVLTIIAGERKSVWSDLGTGRTNPANKEPRFDDRPSSGAGSDRGTDHTITRTVDENTPSGRPIGRPVRAEDGDGHPRTYKLIAADAPNADDFEKFDIDDSSGQIRTKSSLNYEDTDCGYIALNDTDTSTTPTTCAYTVKVEVRDGYNTHKVELEESETAADDTITVTINVRDREERPDAPTVTLAAPDTETTLDVIWDVPENTGPVITGYDLQYRKGSDAFSDDNCENAVAGNCTGIAAGTTNITIVELEADTSYSVQVRARNVEGPSAWSRLVTIKTNKTNNISPSFSGVANAFSVAENTPSGQPVGSVSASDNDSTQLTYTLEGVDAASFSFNTRNGDISTRSSLNHETPACGYVAPADPTTATTCTYSVRVKASDGSDGGSAYHTVTITVTDVNEPPAPPAGPRVTATKDSGWSLDVTWNEPPRNAGKPPVTDYDIRYRKKGEDDDSWQEWAHGADQALDANGDTDRSATITTIGTAPAVHLEPRTEYEVEVRASNAEGTSDWSNIGTGRTGAGNSRPIFDRTEAVVTLSVDENTRSAQSIGSAISATDADSNRLTYSLEGPNKDLFTIVSSSGQIRTRAALDYETRQSYSLTVKVDDGSRRANSGAAKSVTIEVNDVDEIPPPPAAPTVSGIAGSTDSVRVTWNASANKGPAITDYEVRYGEAGSGGWNTLVGRTGADRSQIITELTAGTRYEVQVRAKSPEGTGDWSRSGTGSPNPDVANRPPTFSGGTRSFDVAENTVAGTDVGNLVTATDRDGDNLTYTLEGTDAPSFSILSTGGGAQIQTSASLNHEEKSSYLVTVRVRDGRGGTDAVNVTIRVTDVDGEAPGTPVAPTVTAVSSTSLQVSWDAPANTGPPITDYDYRYRATGAWTEVTNTAISTTSVTIEGLTALTLYEVEVRATNAEGTSAWSNSGFEQTNAPGANNPPVFSDGATAARSVSATSPAGTNVGEPVAATDADVDDTVTYSLEGTDEASFDIVSTSGQIQTKAGVTLTVGATYNVTVVADDTKDRTTIAVTIEATAAPPNNPPVFTEGASTTRTIRDDARAGTDIGGPVRATDADTGDTLTYSLEGTDAASFSIAPTNGQIRTLAALDASTKSAYSVTVRATDSQGGSATIAVTINITARPTSYGCATRGAVADTSNTGLVADCEALRASRDSLEDGGARLNWHEGTPISQWQGIKLGGTPMRVVEVNLTSYRLAGTLPAELGNVSMLTALKMRNNQLTGSIPPELNRLTRLETLLLHDNELSGPIPDLSNLRRLEWLWLSGRDMNLTGNLPSWMGNMSSLESVSLWGNNLDGFLPNLSGMTSIKELKLQSNRFRGDVPSWFADMRSLRQLYLHDNQFSGSIPSAFGRHTGLLRLWLDRNQLTGSIPPALGNMTNLKTLNLRDNRLSGTIPWQLGNLRNLQQLRLHNNGLTGSIPTELSSLSNLIQLWVSGNQLSGSIPASLGGMSSLRDLNLRLNSLSGAIPPELGALSDTLTRLRIGGTVERDANGVITREVRGNAGLTGCVPASLRSATDPDDLRLAGASGISICQ